MGGSGPARRRNLQCLMGDTPAANIRRIEILSTRPFSRHHTSRCSGPMAATRLGAMVGRDV
jgi:hypothetical protein